MSDAALAVRAAAVIDEGELDLGLLPRALRRGLSGVMKLAIAAATRTLASAAPAAPRALAMVYGSAYGETRTALELLTSITQTGVSSPVLFRHSVHNAAPGLLSIAIGSGAPAIAVAAGQDTVLASLFEAAALLREGHREVLLLIADDGVPAELRPAQTSRAGAVGCLLSADASDAIAYLTRPERAGATAATIASPLDPARALAEAALGGQTASVALSARAAWRVRMAPRKEALA